MRFEKVSYDEWLRRTGEPDGAETRQRYENIVLPRRSTSNSAGYDFFFPHETESYGAGEQVTICTGIRWVVEEKDPPCVLLIAPRSSVGIKHGVSLANTIGIIDADYCHADNEGHILAALRFAKSHTFAPADRFMQGIIVPFITCGDEVDAQRIGGVGSTGQ